MTPDIIIRNGMVFDGLGSPPQSVDIAVHNGVIAETGKLPATAKCEIDATGLYVAPGFIDIHSHSDFTLLVDPRAISSITQGVTLEIIGNCGHGCFPLINKQLAKNSIYGISDDVTLDWSTPSAYLDRLEAASPAVNVMTLVPNGQLRQAVVGLKNRPADSAEIAQMLHYLEEGLEAGAFGFSTGLEYPVEVGVTAQEIGALLKPVARQGLLYASHTRWRDKKSVTAVEEALQTARDAGIRLQISHLLPRGGRADCLACLEVVDRAHRDGQDISFDMHTREFSLTFLHAMLPAWAMEGGLAGLRSVISNPENRARIHAHPSIVTGGSGGWPEVTLLDNNVAPEFGRKNFAEIGAAMNMPPSDAALELLARSANSPHPLMMIRPVYEPRDQDLAFEHDLCVPGGDATALCPDGPLAGSAFHGAYSWASWFYRSSVRDRRILTPEAAIHKLTGQPAAIMNLSRRGVLTPGAFADIVVFDPDEFGERATTWEPNQTAVGMKHVIVNGELAIYDGRLTDKRSGQVIRKKSS